MRKSLPRVRAALGVTRVPDAELVVRLTAAHDRLNGNPDFPKPPVDLPVFKATIDSFAVAVAEALGGGTKALTERDSRRHAAIVLYEQLGHYVQASCNNDPATFASSGFIAKRRSVRITDWALSPPGIQKIEQGNSGQLRIAMNVVPRTLHYELRYAAVDADSIPGAWTTMMPTITRAAVDGLKPGTIYAFQVRAFGRFGYTDWSDSATRMCI